MCPFFLSFAFLVNPMMTGKGGHEAEDTKDIEKIPSRDRWQNSSCTESFDHFLIKVAVPCSLRAWVESIAKDVQPTRGMICG